MALYLLGTDHISEKSKKAVTNVFTQTKFDAVLLEGVEHHKKIVESLVKEPFLFLIFKIWLSGLNRKGSENKLANKLAKENNISVFYIDRSLDELIEYFHKPYNNIINLVFILLILSLNYIMMALSFLLIAFYFIYHRSKIVMQFRNEFFYKKINEKIESGLYGNILFICGRDHIDFIKRKFPNSILLQG